MPTLARFGNVAVDSRLRGRSPRIARLRKAYVAAVLGLGFAAVAGLSSNPLTANPSSC
jgi:hypothetical protein